MIRFQVLKEIWYIYNCAGSSSYFWDLRETVGPTPGYGSMTLWSGASQHGQDRSGLQQKEDHDEPHYHQRNDSRYLGVHLDKKLDWKINSEAVCRKGMSRRYFLRKLGSFNVRSKMFEIFYQHVQRPLPQKIPKKLEVVEERGHNKLTAVLDNKQWPTG